MINVCTIKYGTKYPSSLVNNLFDKITKHCKNINFFCLTDDSTNLDTNIKVIPYTDDYKVYRHWNKIRFFDPYYIQAGYDDQTIIMDIDQIITKDPSSLINFEVNKNQFCSADRHWVTNQHGCPINGGFYKFNSYELIHIKRTFFENPNYYMEYYVKNGKAIPTMGEQNFVYDQVLKTHSVKFLPSEWVVKFDRKKYDNVNAKYFDKTGKNILENGKFNKDVILVHFSGVTNKDKSKL